MPRHHLSLAVTALVATAALALGHGHQATPETPPGTKLDVHGDPLTTGALARLGTLRFRHRNQNLAGLTPDGKSLVLFGRDGLQVMDADTGKITQWSQTDYRLASRFNYIVDGSVGANAGPITRSVFPGSGNGFYSIVFYDRMRLELLTASGKALLLPESSEDFDYAVFAGATGKRLHQLRAAELSADGRLSFLALSGDGNSILAQASPSAKGNNIDNGGPPGDLRCFDITTKQVKYEIGAPKQGRIRTTTLSDDGKALLFVVAYNAGKGELQLWDIAKGTQIRKLELNPDHAKRVQLTGDGKHLFAVDRDASTIRVLDAMAGTETQKFALSKDTIQSFLASRDGKHLFLVTPEGIHQWDVPKAQKLRTLVPGYGEKRLALSPTGDRLFFVGNTSVTVWDTATGKKLRSHSGHAATVWAVTFSPDGKQVLTSSGDGVARLWDSKSLEHLREFSPQGLSNQPTYGGEPFGQAPFVQAGFSSNGRLIVTAWPNSSVDVWDAGTGKKHMKLAERPAKYGSVAIACSSRDNLVATVAPDGQIRVWDVLHGEQRLGFHWQTTKNDNMQLDVAAVAFAPNGSTLAVAGLHPPRNGLKLFETSTGKLRLHVDLVGKLQPDLGEVPGLVLAQRLVTKLAYSNDGKILALAGVHSVHLHDAATGKERLVLGGMNTFGPSFSLSSDGTLAASGTLDGFVRIWDAKSGRLLSEVKGHEFFVAATAFSPDGKMLASTSNDSTVLLWDVAQLLQQKAQPRAVSDASLDRLWNDLASGDAAKAFAAMGELAEAPADAPKYFNDRLQAVPVADPKRIDDLVMGLGSEQYTIRQKASAELEKLADIAVPALRAQLAKKPSLEMHKRLELLLKKINGPATDPEVVRALRAVEVLESIGTPQAQAVLEVLAKGAPAHRLTQAAADAHKRLQTR
jgi:WD40 repeat protein